MAIVLLVAALIAVAHTCNAFKAMGYYFIPGSLNSLEREIARLDEVSFDTFAIDRRGNVRGSVPKAARDTARRNNATLEYLCVTNYGPNDFNGPRVHAVLSNIRSRNRLINALVAKTKADKYDGVNIDFEAIPRKDRNKFTTFIRLLSQRLHAIKRKLVVSVPAKEQDDIFNEWSGAFNFAALGRYVDVLQLMTYDEHGPWDPENPGPVAGLDWVKRCVQYALSVMPPGKISVGIPAYGYVYDLTGKKAESLRWRDFSSVTSKGTMQWDVTAASPYVEWTTEDGKSMVAWIENAQSIREKANFIRNTTGIHGASVWALGHEDSSFWDALLDV